MSVMFWIWLGIMVSTLIVECVTMEVVSIWFTFGAIIPFILATTKATSWQVQVIIFIVVSIVLISTLRQITKKFLLKNATEKTNADAFIGKKYVMMEGAGFEKVGALKINGVVWSAISQDGQEIKTNEIVEVVKISGNKLVVKKIDK